MRRRATPARRRTPRADDGPRQPGRPVGADGDRTRERILEKAIETFADAGFAGASVRDIAGKARIRVSSLYHYFPSKGALYLAVEERVAQQIREITLSSVPRGSVTGGVDLRAMARDSVGRLFDFYLARPAYVRLGYRFHLDAGVRPGGSERIFERWVGLIEALMKPAETQGILKPIDPPLLMASVEGLLASHLTNDTLYRTFYGTGIDDPATAARVREHVIQMVLRAIGLE